MKNAALVLAVAVLASCASTSSSVSVLSSTITENTISENIISENIISEDFWYNTSDIQRSPTDDELLLAPSFNLTPNRKVYVPLYDEATYVSSFDHMDEDAFNGFEATYSDPNNRGWAVILYMDGELRDSYGRGIGLNSFHSHASTEEYASVIKTMTVYINYSISNQSTLNSQDIVTIKVGEFKFQPALTTKVA
jgi:hypothetical protein